MNLYFYPAYLPIYQHSVNVVYGIYMIFMNMPNLFFNRI